MDKETECRIITLETKLAYLEDFVRQLQEMSVAQTKQIDILKQENKLMSGRLQDLSDSLEEIPNRKPPHY
ncbi:MAG: SlyX family protein [Treponema sp.]|nr:SlyX family protein [Treponema sp.]